MDDLSRLLDSYGIVVKLFTDNVKDYLCITSAIDVTKLQQSLDLIAGWVDKWQLGLSIEKCYVMPIGNPTVNATYYIDNKELPQLVQCIDLEITITIELSSVHIQQIS